VKQKGEERKKIQNEIQLLNKERLEYIATQRPQESNESMLDAAMIKAVRQLAKEKNLSWQ